jgi:hypothetical protein
MSLDVIVEGDIDMDCHRCVCPRLPGLEEHARSVNGDIKEIKEAQKEQSKKIDGLWRVGIGILCAITSSSIMLAINLIVNRGVKY